MEKVLVQVQCRDKVGIVAAISGILASRGLNIVVMREFVDPENQQFFARVVCTGENAENALLEEELKTSLDGNANIKVSLFKVDKKVAVLVTKEHHCLGDILVSNFFGLLGANVCCVISNRNILASFTERFSIPFYHITHEGKSKQQFELELFQQVAAFKPDYIVLAKFMRILSEEFVSKFSNRIINIHHSFLPAFIGANPYRQAHKRGVKVIGATAHFVTADLDNGPIISQETIHINHNYNATQMRITGQEIERNVLNKAMNLVFSDKVFVTGNKTVIFE